MPAYLIPYARFQAAPTPAFPEGRLIKRPALVLTLQNGQQRLACYGIIDSGADHCVFPKSFMQPLGLDSLGAPVDMTSGLGGMNVPTHYSDVTIDLGDDICFQVYAGFTSGMDQLGFGLLGQVGFFDRYKITFDYRRSNFMLE